MIAARDHSPTDLYRESGAVETFFDVLHSLFHKRDQVRLEASNGGRNLRRPPRIIRPSPFGFGRRINLWLFFYCEHLAGLSHIALRPSLYGMANLAVTDTANFIFTDRSATAGHFVPGAKVHLIVD
jgi:hypothetical protein